MSNTFWRAQGFDDDYYRSGQGHQGSGGRPLPQSTATGTPVYLKYGIMGLMIGAGKGK